MLKLFWWILDAHGGIPPANPLQHWAPHCHPWLCSKDTLPFLKEHPGSDHTPHGATASAHAFPLQGSASSNRSHPKTPQMLCKAPSRLLRSSAHPLPHKSARSQSIPLGLKTPFRPFFNQAPAGTGPTAPRSLPLRPHSAPVHRVGAILQSIPS